MLYMVPTEQRTYYSFYFICKNSFNFDELEILYPFEFLNTLEFNCFPQYELNLKVNALIMSLINLNPTSRFCNGTRLILKNLGECMLIAIIITNFFFLRNTVYISRIVLSITDKK